MNEKTKEQANKIRELAEVWRFELDPQTKAVINHLNDGDLYNLFAHCSTPGEMNSAALEYWLS